MHFPRSRARLVLVVSLPLIFAYLILFRPPIPFYALLLAPIALAAMSYEFTGGTFVALVAMAGVALLIALDPNAVRRATTLQESWPILIMYLVVGPVVGWLATRERERERRLVSAAERLHVVHEISQAISTSLDLEKTLQTVIVQTQRLVPFKRAAIMLIEGDIARVVAVDEDLRPAADFVGQTFTVKDSAAGWVARQQRTWSGEPADVGQHPDTRALCPPRQPCLIIPLQFQHRVIGVFLLGGASLTGLAHADLDNLEQIASQIAIAIEHARLYEAERQWARHIAAIGEASREIAGSLDLDRTLKLVMAKGAETLPMDAGALFLFDLEAQAYRVAVSHNLSSDHVAQMTFAFEEGVPGWVVKHRQTLIVPNAAIDDRVHPHVVEDGVQSVLAAPLVARDQVVGVLNLYCKAQTDAFDDEALRLTEVFAAQTAVAIENARLMDELRLAAAELEARVERRTRQLRESQAQIVRAEKMAVVGRLAASVAHEVNNPLQAIALQLQLIGDERLTKPANERLAIVREEVSRIAEMVQRLLDFQRPALGQRSQHDVSRLLDDVLVLADKQLQQHDISVVRQDGPDLNGVLVAGNQIKQVFLNLILNAVEAMPGGGQLHVRTQQHNGTVSVTFSDTGVGLSPEVEGQLFEPFFTTKTRGSGLGLAISHEIVVKHGGRLEASGGPDRGATFTVNIPVDRADLIVIDKT
jgi:two-component system NtrC family sensor kinase